MDDNRTRGWLLARLELAIAVVVVLVATIIVVTSQPLTLHGFGGGRWEQAYVVWAAVLPYVGEALAIIGLVWMVRIGRGPLRDRVPDWRYRR